MSIFCIREKSIDLGRSNLGVEERSENESDGGELPCSKLDSDEEIRLSETDFEESEETADGYKAFYDIKSHNL
ncbi:hypothetical protein TNCV_869561 [Trichonephila clavipes]|nr:hypothetical protein TNCV_869561 [Trichonephila clavipes]